MLYDYKSEELVQDIILEDIEILVDDIVEEFYSLRRYNELDIYVSSYFAKKIISRLFHKIEELWVHADSHDNLLYKDDNEVIITIANDGMLFVEEARINRVLKSAEDSSLSYVYDEFSKKDIDYLSESAESILVFGFEEDDLECTCDCEDCSSCSERTDLDINESESTYVSRDKDGTPLGFSKTWTTVEDGIHCYSSYSHYSNNLDILKEIASDFGVRL